MKKKKNILSIAIITLLIILTLLIMIIFAGDKKEKQDSYSEITINDYSFNLNEKYEYKYLKDKKYGIFENKDFLSSYIYISSTNYSDLILKTSTYTNMGSDELDTSIEEMNFGDYQGFINIKKVHYNDVNKDYNLVIILIKLDDAETLVIQYEISVEKESQKIFTDIKNSLSNIKKIN